MAVLHGYYGCQQLTVERAYYQYGRAHINNEDANEVRVDNASARTSTMGDAF